MYNINLLMPPEGVKFSHLPLGEPHVDVEIIDQDIYIDARGAHNWNVFARLLVLLNALSFQDTNSNIYVYIPYFPGSHQCDQANGCKPLTVQLNAALLSAATQHQDDRFTFYTFDMHSREGLKLAREYIDLTDVPVSMNNPKAFDQDIEGIIAPSADSRARAKLFRDELFEDAEFVQCDERIVDGVVHYEIVEGNLDPSVGKWLVIDGTFDGNVRFNRLASTVLTQTTAFVQLYVSHWLHRPFFDTKLCQRYDKFYTPPTLSPVHDTMIGAVYDTGLLTCIVDLPKPVFH